MKDTLQRYIDLRPVLLAIVEENRESIQSIVYQHVTYIALKICRRILTGAITNRKST